MKKKFCIFSIARSDYGILKNIIYKINKDKRFKPYIIIGGSHFSEVFGNTFKEIKKDRVKNIIKISKNYNLSSNIGILSNFEFTFDSIKKFYKKNKIDGCLILGDRYEMLAAALVSFQFKVPIFHLCGGSITSGSLDNTYRNIISNMSHTHFVETSHHKKQLQKMNIKKNIFISGSPSLEVKNSKLINKQEFEKIYNFKFRYKKTVVASYHPETTKPVQDNLRDLKVLVNFLKKVNCNVVFTYPNADLGFNRYIQIIKKLKNKNNVLLIKHLGKKNYFSLLKFSDIMIGNSSSGIIESASFKIPNLNLGNRQKNRIKMKNSIDVKFNTTHIKKYFNKLLNCKLKGTYKNMKNIYQGKNTSAMIINKIYKSLV